MRDTAARLLRNKIPRQIPTEEEGRPIDRIREHVCGDIKIIDDTLGVDKSAVGDVLVAGMVACCPPAWPFAIMGSIFGMLSGRRSRRSR